MAPRGNGGGNQSWPTECKEGGGGGLKKPDCKS